MADLYINPQGYIVDKATQPVTGNQKIDSYLSELPIEERDAALKELQAPLTGEEVAEMLKEDLNWKPNKEQFNAFSAYQAHKETSLFDGLALFGEAASAMYDIAGNVVASMYDHPIEDAAKLAPSLLEGGVQNIRNWYGMLAQSQDPSSVLFKFKNALARDGSDDAYKQFLEAREFAKDSHAYETGEKTMLVNKDYVDASLVQAATIIVDPMFYGSFLVGAGEVGLAHKAAQILGMSERLTAASAWAGKMKGAVYGGALKYGVGVPLEFIGDITRGAMDKALVGGSNILESATGISAQELRQAARVGGFGSIGFGVPYISPTSKAYLGAGFAGRLGEAISATGEQILKNQGKRGLLSFAEQAIAESDAILAKGGSGLTPQARKLLGIINKADPMFSYAGAFMEGGAHGAVIGAGLGALGGGEEGAWSGAGAGFGIGSMGGVAGRALSNVGGGLEKQRLAVQMDMLMPMLKDIDPTKHSTIDLIRKANRAAGNPDWVVDRYIVALDKIAPDTRMFAGGAKDNEAVLRAKGQDPKVYDGFERDAKGDYVLDKNGNKVKLRDAEGYSIPTMAEYEAAGWTIQDDANGKIKIHINTDNLGDLANTLPHEMFHGIFRELGMKPEFQNRINEHILGTFDANGKQIKPPSISKYEAKSFFSKYINNAYQGNDKTERLAKLNQALDEYYSTGKMTVMEADGKTPVLAHMTEEFGAYYWTQFLNDKPVDYLFRGGDLGGVRGVLDSVKNRWQDYMERKVGGVNGGFDFAREKSINKSFLDAKGKRVRVSALDYMMQDLIRTKSAASKGQAFDFNALSPDGQRAYVEASGNSVAFEPPAVKGGKYKVRSEAQQTKIRAKNSQAMHTGLEGFRTSNPDILRIKDAQGNDIGGLSVDADGNYVGTVPDAIIDYFVKSGHIDKVEGERIRILQQAARGETPSNVFEFSDYTGATMHTGVGADVRAVSPNVPTKDRLVILTDFSVKISGKDYGFYAHTLDYRHLQLRVDNSWKDPKVRVAWGDDRDAFVSDLFRYFKNASQPDGKRLPSAQLWSVDGEYKRNIMHDVAGVQTPASGTINTANAPIAGDMFSTFRKFRTDRMTQERMSGEKIDLRGDNAIDYIRHNMMPSEMSHEATPAGDGVWVHPNGYKFFKTDKGIKAVKEDGTRIGTFSTIEEATKAADTIYQKENPTGKPIPSVDNIRKEPLDAPENQEQFVQRKINSFYERPESVLDLFNSKEWKEWWDARAGNNRNGNNYFGNEHPEYSMRRDEFENTVKTIISDANKPNQGDRFATDFIDYGIADSVGTKFQGSKKEITSKDIFNDFFKDQYFKEQEANNPTFVSGLSVALDKILPANVNKEGTIQASRLLNLMKSASGGDIGKILTEANAIGFTDWLKSKGQARVSESEIRQYIQDNGIKVSIDPRTDIRGNEWQGGGFDTSRYVAEGKKEGYYTFVARINPEHAHGVEGHFGGDTIAHIRATIRTDAQGRKVLFVEEIQSINTAAGVPSPELRVKLESELKDLKKWEDKTANFEQEVQDIHDKYSEKLGELQKEKTDAKLSSGLETRAHELARIKIYDDKINKVYKERENRYREVWEKYKDKIEPKYKEKLEKQIDYRKEIYKGRLDTQSVFYNLHREINGGSLYFTDYSRKISEIQSKLAKKKSNKPLQDFNETVKIANRTIMRKAVELGADRVVLVRPEDMHPDVSVNAEGERFVDAAYGTDIPAMINAELKKYGQELRTADNISKSKAYETSDTHDTHKILSESLGYDITPEMKQKAGRSQTFMMPSEGKQGAYEQTKQAAENAWGMPIIEDATMAGLSSKVGYNNKFKSQSLLRGTLDSWFSLMNGSKNRVDKYAWKIENGEKVFDRASYEKDRKEFEQKREKFLKFWKEKNGFDGINILDVIKGTYSEHGIDKNTNWISPSADKNAERYILTVDQLFDKYEEDFNFEYKEYKRASSEFEKTKEQLDNSEIDKTFQTGKPVAVKAYHGTPYGEVKGNSFDQSMLGSFTKAPSAKEAYFFAGSEKTSRQYAITGDIHGERVPYEGWINLTFEERASIEYEIESNYYKSYKEQGGKKSLESFTKDLIKDKYQLRDIIENTTGKDFSTEIVKKAKILPFFVKFENPLVFDQGGEAYREKSYFDLIKQAKQEGRDGVIILDTKDGGDYDIIYAVLPNHEGNIKSAKPNTYNDKGNKVPLSKRFDSTNKDIRYMPSEGEYRSGDNYWKAKNNPFEGVDESGQTYRLAYAVVNGKTEYHPEFVSWLDIGHGSGNSKDIKRFGLWGENPTNIKENGKFNKDEIITKPLGNNFVGDHKNWFEKEFKYSEEEPTSMGRYELPVYDSKGKLKTRGRISITDKETERSMSSFKNLKEKVCKKLNIKSEDVDAYIFGGRARANEELGISHKDQLPIRFMPPDQVEAWRNFKSEPTTEGNSIFKNAMNFVIIQANNKFKVYNPQKALLGIYTDLEEAKKRVRREEPKPR